MGCLAAGCSSSSGKSNGEICASGSDIIHDVNQHLCWLADANFAASSAGQAIQAQMGVSGIEPNGAMDYTTAQSWVAALNAVDGGKGYLGHHTWQLPGTPMKDPTCGALGPQGASFGGLCQGDALGNLYYQLLNQMLPDDVAPGFGASVGPLQNVQLAYYWTSSDAGVGGKQVFSFIGIGDATTTNDSYYYVLPMVPSSYGPIVGTDGKAPTCGAGATVVLYTDGPAANQAVYDCVTGNTWLVDANLANTNAFGLTGDVPGGITEKRPYPQPNPTTITAPQISGGAMLFTTATQWVTALASSDYLGSMHWQLPASAADMRALYTHLQLAAGDALLAFQGSAGPFQNLQPFFYWETCVPDPNGTGGTSADCAQGNAPPSASGNQMNFDFTFGYGIQATDAATLKYFAMVNYSDGTQ